MRFHYLSFIALLSFWSAQSLQAEQTLIDLTYAYDESTIYWPTSDLFEQRTVSEGLTDKGFYYSAYWFATAEHGGTHLDAPVHFLEGGLTTDQLPLEQLIGEAVCVDVSESLAGNADGLISVADLQTWEQQHKSIPKQAIVLLRTGWGSRWPNVKAYLGTDQRGAEAIKQLHFPGLSSEAAKWLIEKRQINAIGIDTASIDRGQSTNYLAHRALAAAGVPVFENVAHLDQLPATGFQVIALPIKLKGGSGGPARIVAVID